MDSKKRPHSNGEDHATTKKRVLTGPNGTPHVNGLIEQEEPTEGDSLELFRKEAIFRRMRHYSRENERSQCRIAELEQRKHTCEVGLAAMSACWNQLFATIRLLVKSDDLPDVKDEMFNFTLHIQDGTKPDFTETLKDNMSVTQALVTKLVEAGGETQQPSDTFKECQKATAECIALRSQMDIMRTQLKDSEMQRDQYHTALIAAENRLDRLQSKTVLAIQSRAVEKKPEVMGDAIEELQRKPSSPEGHTSPVHGSEVYDSTELDILREHVNSREVKIIELEREVTTLRNEKTLLESELRLLSYDKIKENPFYKNLLDHSALLKATVLDNRAQLARLSEEFSNCRTARKEWEEGVIAAAGQANQELKTMLAKRDVENARLRDQREQQAAELNERKQRDSTKFTSLQELKALADSRSERILVLESEVRRHKAQLAANSGNEDLMLFFTNGGSDEAAYFDSLKDRVTAAENRAAAMEHTFSIFQDDHPNVVEHMKAEANALQKLSEAEAQLTRYEKIYVYGDPPSLPSDVSKLADRLKQKEDEIQKLRLLDIQHTQAETSLYAELDKLSTAWEALDRQVKSKVFDLKTMEDRLTKSGLDRAKSENKFYAAMRDKEAIEAERKNLVRNSEKQVKVIERLADSEKNLYGQLSTLEKELALLKTATTTYRDKVTDLTEEVNQWKVRGEAEQRKANDLRAVVSEREKELTAKRAELRKLEDGFNRSKRELEQKRKETSIRQSTSMDAEAQDLLQLLKCSCRKSFRNTVITKCMHTFCKECVDARISTRQRKCPACGAAFSQSDVLYGMYFQ